MCLCVILCTLYNALVLGMCAYVMICCHFEDEDIRIFIYDLRKGLGNVQMLFFPRKLKTVFLRLVLLKFCEEYVF